MLALLWFSGINGDTSMRDIGWSYVFIIVAIIVAIKTVRDYIKLMKDHNWF